MRFPITFSLTNATLNILWRNLRSLSRAPVFVVLVLTEGGMKYEDAVQFIRQK
ncbi:hypothetical protein E2I00_001564 [Balaenoptera physalus]|uniref:Uncharacterized protein n=1 Tax=Balaenoptera physalus TaxID=9770 RepID=A0A6A1QIN9_BALPH|nr:hypothetical protein E2I00_001564 [Balaenoptera physalus]